MACNDTLYKHEQVLCTNCIYKLPKTNFHKDINNPVSKVFWGRVNLERAASYYYFNKDTCVQQLLHNLKYKGRKEVGTEVGKLYGKELANADGFKNADLIIPVPLHPEKKKKRGYNQSDFFASGLSESMKIDWNSNALERSANTETQTSKARFTRWQNVSEIFKVKDSALLNGLHILLVDDVLTTGSTLEACAQSILQLPGTKVSIATIAFA